MLELLHDVNIVGDQSWPKTFCDHFVSINWSTVPDGFLSLYNIVLNYLNLFQTLFLIKRFQILLEFRQLMNHLRRLGMVANRQVFLVESEVPDYFQNLFRKQVVLDFDMSDQD